MQRRAVRSHSRLDVPLSYNLRNDARGVVRMDNSNEQVSVSSSDCNIDWDEHIFSCFFIGWCVSVPAHQNTGLCQAGWKTSWHRCATESVTIVLWDTTSYLVKGNVSCIGCLSLPAFGHGQSKGGHVAEAQVSIWSCLPWAHACNSHSSCDTGRGAAHIGQQTFPGLQELVAAYAMPRWMDALALACMACVGCPIGGMPQIPNLRTSAFPLVYQAPSLK